MSVVELAPAAPSSTAGSPALQAHRVVVGQVRYVSRIAGRLLVVGWHGEESAPAQRRPEAPLVEATHMTFPYTPPLTVGEGRSRDGTGFLAVLVADDIPSQAVLLGLGRVSLRIGPDQLREALVDLRALAWEGLAGLDTEHRKRAAAFAASAAPALGSGAHRRAVAGQLHAVRETLRDVLPEVQIDPGQARGIFIDQLYGLDDRAFYARGWLRDTESEVTSLVMVSPEGARVDILPTISRYPRPDVDAFYGQAAGPVGSGFLCHFVLPAPTGLELGWKVEMRDATGVGVEAPVPAVISDPLAARTAVLGDLVYDLAPDAPFLKEHAHPALSRLTSHRDRLTEVVAVQQFGRAVSAPDVTVLVPLYKRLDFLEHQLAAFVHDPAMREVDLVYVLDSPELSDQALAVAEGLSRLYDVPFRLLLLRRNLGFADANNVGAAYARGRLLLLLNSDVLPDRPGWLAALVDAHDLLPGVGAGGAKLLYEDDSLQHAGMYFDRPAGSALWTNGHYFKGLHRSFGPACVERPVPAVTGACLLLATELWQAVGGLCGGYVQGDYEDSDLCLRLLGMGRRNWFVPSAELYHLEGQSYPDDLRRAVGRYNTWLQTHLWNKQLGDAMHDYGTPPEL